MVKVEEPYSISEISVRKIAVVLHGGVNKL